MAGVYVPAVGGNAVAPGCSAEYKIISLEESVRHMTCSGDALAVLAMAMAHQYRFTIDPITYRAA